MGVWNLTQGGVCLRIEKIGDNKIKVMIDGEEAKARRISFKNISENTPEVQAMFRTAIRLAEENTDFSIAGAKLFVEALRGECEDDGFGMMITRVFSQQELDAAVANCAYRGRLTRTRLTAEPLRETEMHIYRFRDFETVCTLAEEIADTYSGESVLYKYKQAFYLYLVPEDEYVFAEIRAIFTEFGTEMQNGRFLQGRLNEYGEKMIPERAMEVLERYFCLH